MNQNKQTFKAGDKVYYPCKSTKILTLQKHTSFEFPFKVINGNSDMTFTKQGKEYLYDNVPTIFHATKKNCKKLSELYGIQFEEPKSFLDIHLEKGSKVLCLIVNNQPLELPKHIWELDFNEYHVSVIVRKVDNTYYSLKGKRIEERVIYPIAIDDRGRITYLD